MMTFCEYCNKFVSTHTKTYEDSVEVKGIPIKIVADGSFCDECERQLFDRDADNNALLMAYREYRKQKRLLQPEDIKRIREKYGLTQVSFSRLLGFGDKTITRYERGALQDEAPDTLISSVDSPKAMLDILNKKRDRIPQAECEKAMTIVEDLMAKEHSLYEDTSYVETSWMVSSELHGLIDQYWEAVNYGPLLPSAA